MDYSKTVNLPRTDFPMRANLIQREPEMLRFWEEKDIFRKMADLNAKGPRFILHDGPPYANGHIHLGTAFNKTLKDVAERSQMRDGKQTPFRPGWDCHGMPIEHQVMQKSGRKKAEVDPVSFRKEAAEYAKKFVEIQKKEFQRLGVYGDWNNSYLTLRPEYEAQEVRIFADLALSGYIYRGKRPIYWCTHCETALAEAEIEYKDLKTDSIYIFFPVVEDPQKVLSSAENAFFLVWTTTPWTLPANVALLVHPELNYSLVEFEGRNIILAENLIPVVFGKAGKKAVRREANLKGEALTTLLAKHPFLERRVPVLAADFVSAEDGSGIVHCAPGHGEEDFLVGKEYGLPVLSPVNETGHFTAEVSEWDGLSVWDANPLIVQKLRDNNLLLFSEEISHNYPTCWRCKNPVIFRATDQWFLNVDHQDLRQRLIKVTEEIKFLPPESQKRMAGMLETRPDWCLSRQRHWGVPVPIIRCQDCGKPLMERNVFDRIAEVFSREGSDSWFQKEAKYFVPDGVACPCGGNRLEKEKDIIDVWFDSGVSWAGVLERAGHYPADLYLEGSDQHRGWFQTSLITSMATRGKAPFRQVLTHGFMVDESGRKMSKSLGNVITSEEVLKEFGADIIRLWAASQDYGSDIKTSLHGFKVVAEQYRTIRNTLRFILGNLSDFDPDTHAVQKENLLPVDRWALAEVSRFQEEASAGYQNFSFYRVAGQIYEFCNLTLSAFYLDILKDRLYTYSKNAVERRSGQTALYHAGRLLIGLLAPILVFTAEEAWRYLPHQKGSDLESIHLHLHEDFKEFKDEALITAYGEFFSLRKEVLKTIEEVRAKGKIGSSLEAKVEIKVNPELLSRFSPLMLEKYLKELLIVSETEISAKPEGSEPEITVSRTNLPKCPRCWVHSGEIGQSSKYPDLCPKCADAVSHLQNVM